MFTAYRRIIPRTNLHSEFQWGRGRGGGEKSTWEGELPQPLWKRVWRFLQKLKLQHDLVILLLGTDPKDAGSSHRDTCSFTFIAAVLMIAKKWIHPRRPSADGE